MAGMTALLQLYHWMFGCRHEHISRVFCGRAVDTNRKHYYRVCFDCGLVIPYTTIAFDQQEKNTWRWDTN
jgi:hypothetical protein